MDAASRLGRLGGTWAQRHRQTCLLVDLDNDSTFHPIILPC